VVTTKAAGDKKIPPPQKKKKKKKLKIHQDPCHMLVSDLMNTPLAIMLM
jgi:hypothetical protein